MSTAYFHSVTEAYQSTEAYQKSKTNAGEATASAKASASYKSETTAAVTTETPAATYKKSEEAASSRQSKGKYVTLSKQNQETIARLKADADARAAQFRSLVEDMLLKQGKTLTLSDNLYAMLRKGEIEVTPEVQAQAKKDIAEDGYWGVEQTSERLVSFAKAISGDNPEMADKLIKAVEKGFKQATKTWGDTLPDICKKTLDTTIEKLEKWRDSLNSTDEATDAAADAFLGQAGAAELAK